MKVEATPDYSTRSTSMQLNAANLRVKVWEGSSNIPSHEGPDGSDCCCTFKIQPSRPNIVLSGEWPRMSDIDQFTVQGLLNNTVLLEATSPSPHLARFDCYPLFKTTPTFPCRYAGDWKWRIRSDPGKLCHYRRKCSLFHAYDFQVAYGPSPE